MVLLCALVVGSNAWADTAIATATATNGKSYVVAYFVNNKYYALPHGTSATVYDGTEVTLNGINKVNETTAADLAWTLTEGTTAGQFYLSYTSGTTTYYLYKNGSTSNTNYNIKGNSNASQKHYWEFTLNSSNNDYTIKSLKSDQGTSTAIYLGYATAGKFGVYAQANAAKIILLEIGDDPSATPTCVAPTFSPAAGAVLSGTEVTLSTTTEGATIYYTMGDNPADPTNTSTAYDSNNKPTITAATTIKAIAIKAGSNNSTVSSASYTIATPFANIAALTADATASPKTGFVTFSGAIVTFVSGNNAYLQDASGAVLFYKSGHGLTAGKVLTGTAAVTYKLNYGNPQITDLSGITPAAGSAPDPTSVAQSAWNYTFTNVLNKYFQITGATLTKTDNKYYVQLGSDNVQLFKSGGSIGDLNLSKKYTITGFPLLYNSTKELQIYADPVEEATTDPLIDASNLTIEFDATSGEIPYTIENPTGASLSAEITTGDWISNIGYASGKVTFTATANTGAQRTATITLSYTGADNRVITVTQKKYGIATLPFTFDGGKSDVESANNYYGISHTGLGSDYTGSPKLKFDDTGDNVVLRFNEEPGILSFSIKGNSFSGGTFTVQTSADGTAYTNLDSYTTLGDAETKTYNLESSVRYVKWIYTSKSSGNVALGNINLALPGEPSLPVVNDVAHTVTLTTTANMEGWRTFTPSKADQNYTADADVYYVSASGATTVTLTKIDGGVPANTPVILHKTSGTTIILTETATVITAPGASNLLAVSTANQNLGNVFRLGYKSGAGKGVGFYSYTSANAPAGIIYINAPSAARDFLNFDFGDEATGVNDVRGKMSDVRGDYYDLQGRKVANPTKGLYIVNGKKVIIK